MARGRVATKGILGLLALTTNRRPVGRLGRVVFRNVEHAATMHTVRSACKSSMLELRFNAFPSACTPGRDVPNGRTAIAGRSPRLSSGPSERRDLQDAANCSVTCDRISIGTLCSAATSRKRTERRHRHLYPLLRRMTMATYRSLPHPFDKLGVPNLLGRPCPSYTHSPLPPAILRQTPLADNQRMHRSTACEIFRDG